MMLERHITGRYDLDNPNHANAIKHEAKRLLEWYKAWNEAK